MRKRKRRRRRRRRRGRRNRRRRRKKRSRGEKMHGVYTQVDMNTYEQLKSIPQNIHIPEARHVQF